MRAASLMVRLKGQIRDQDQEKKAVRARRRSVQGTGVLSQGLPQGAQAEDEDFSDQSIATHPKLILGGTALTYTQDMGEYLLSAEELFEGRPVYKQREGGSVIYWVDGSWVIGELWWFHSMTNSNTSSSTRSISSNVKNGS